MSERFGAGHPALRHGELKRQLACTLRKLAKLKAEGLALALALPHLQPFHEANVKWRLVDGSNRSGKTFSCCYETAGALCGLDPYDKYPLHGGQVLMVAQELDDLTRIWRTLAEPGAFKVIPDEKTGVLRAVRPDPKCPARLDSYDDAYREKWRDGPPLLPARLIRSVAWENRGKRQPRMVRVGADWTMLMRSSKGDPPQGEHYNAVWFDEQLENEEFFDEANRGLVGLSETPRHKPKGIWSATSQTTNLQLFELREAADGGADYVRAFTATIDQNPYVPPEEKKAFFDSLDEEQRAVRYYGHYALLSRRIYSIYQPMGLHGCEPFPVPPEYCRYVILDPGRDHIGTLFVAVDPDERHMYVYDGFDLRKSEARRWAAEVKDRQGEYLFEAFVIDQQAGRQHSMAGGDTMARQYFDAAKEIGLRPRLAGPFQGFFPGSKDVEAREESLLGMMAIRPAGPFQGTAKLQVFRGVLPELDKQMRQAHTDPKRSNKRAKTRSRPQDLLDCLEYAAAFNPPYYDPELASARARSTQRTVADLFVEEQARDRKRQRAKMMAHY